MNPYSEMNENCKRLLPKKTKCFIKPNFHENNTNFQRNKCGDVNKREPITQTAIYKRRNLDLVENHVSKLERKYSRNYKQNEGTVFPKNRQKNIIELHRAKEKNENAIKTEVNKNSERKKYGRRNYKYKETKILINNDIIYEIKKTFSLYTAQIRNEIRQSQKEILTVLNSISDSIKILIQGQNKLIQLIEEKSLNQTKNLQKKSNLNILLR